MTPVKKNCKVFSVCRKCGNETTIDKNVPKFSEKLRHEPLDEIHVIDKGVEVLPLTKIECPECSNNKAQWWTRQTRSSDEPETRFYRCTKCKYTWREYS